MKFTFCSDSKKSTTKISFFKLFIVVISSTLHHNSLSSSIITGTLIKTPTSLMPVEALKVRDKVISCNPDSPTPDEALIEVGITAINTSMTDSIFLIETDIKDLFTQPPIKPFMILFSMNG